MSGSVHYKEKCVCGAEIEMGEVFEFISREKLSAKFETWQRQHNTCLPLFHEVQKFRLRRLKDGYNEIL